MEEYGPNTKMRTTKYNLLHCRLTRYLVNNTRAHAYIVKKIDKKGIKSSIVKKMYNTLCDKTMLMIIIPYPVHNTVSG